MYFISLFEAQKHLYYRNWTILCYDIKMFVIIHIKLIKINVKKHD